ncbi:hypothetical protein GCM10009548_86240 [Streptomyces malaysiensis subsp. malaysiensis]
MQNGSRIRWEHRFGGVARKQTQQTRSQGDTGDDLAHDSRLSHPHGEPGEYECHGENHGEPGEKVSAHRLGGAGSYGILSHVGRLSPLSRQTFLRITIKHSHRNDIGEYRRYGFYRSETFRTSHRAHAMTRGSRGSTGKKSSQLRGAVFRTLSARRPAPRVGALPQRVGTAIEGLGAASMTSLARALPTIWRAPARS